VAGLACLLLAALSTVACTTRDEPRAEPPPAEPTRTSTPSAATRSAQHDQPLVVAVHHGSRLREIPLRRARRIVEGGADGDGAFAVVPASALGPRMRALSVDGADPVRSPEEYPLRANAVRPREPVVTVAVVGDIMLGRGVAEAARGNNHPAPALRPTARRLARADVTVGNLENTLSRAGAPTQGGDSFAADPAVVEGLLEAGFDVLGLANNHLGDFGDRALVQTVRRLRAGGMDTFGAGATVRQAWEPAVVERDGVRFGFLGFNAIGETPAVAPGQPGAVSVGMPPRTGPLDLAALRRFEGAVRRLDDRVDVVVVMPHWGTQYTHRPEPVQSRVARRLVRAGADVVVGGHPHWVQGMEMVGRGLVVHSLGNFVFDMDFMRQTQEGAILELTFWGGRLKAVELVPYVMDERFAPRVVSGRRGEQVLAPMRATSGPAFRSRG
jgi:poly-gamma-glutamate capsule biosynthesis protein CapA/YwtB (metallophosphatase superfamily)